MTTKELDKLLERYYKGQCKPEELSLVNALLDRYAAINPNDLDEEQRREVLKELRHKIELKTGDSSNAPPFANARTAGYKKMAIKWGMAAAMAGLIWASYYFLHPVPGNQAAVAVVASAAVGPGTTSASLVLPDGKTVALDSVRSNLVKAIQVSNSQFFLIKKNGQKVNLEKTAGLQVYSKLVTQRGQQAPQMQLADGTKVWLNAASSLKFPVAFKGATREVLLTGEAYFEVAKDATHPFIVKTATSEIKVLGTHFNVMAYKDEPATYATLLEGAIELKTGDNLVKLTPGEQGIVNEAGKIKVIKVKAQLATQWMNGKLPMDNMEVHAFLREVSRWYDVDIQYKTPIPMQRFSGNLNRDIPLKYIISALKANGVNCQLKGRTLIISKSSNHY